MVVILYLLATSSLFYYLNSKIFTITSINFDIPSAVMECADFSEFQEALKSMRRVDDIIINTLNAVIPTDSFNPDAAKACKELHGKLTEGNSNRKNAIKHCITISAERLKELREHRELDSNTLQISKSLRSEQTKLRMLQVELSVEELVEERTSKVFNERCRKYYKPV